MTAGPLVRGGTGVAGVAVTQGQATLQMQGGRPRPDGAVCGEALGQGGAVKAFPVLVVTQASVQSWPELSNSGKFLQRRGRGGRRRPLIFILIRLRVAAPAPGKAQGSPCSVRRRPCAGPSCASAPIAARTFPPEGPGPVCPRGC